MIGIDILREEFSQICRIRKGAFNKRQNLVSDIKLTNKDEDEKIIKYINSHKTNDTYAFSREEISSATDTY